MRNWIGFIATILVIILASLVKDATPAILAYIEPIEVPCEIPQQVAFHASNPSLGQGYLRKATCPRTEAAHFLNVEVDVEYWEVTGYSIGDSYTPGRNTSDGWQEGLVREVRPGITVACPKELLLGTMVIIDKIGARVCEDRGGAIVGKRLDVAFDTPEAAIVWGKRWVRVAIIRPNGDER